MELIEHEELTKVRELNTKKLIFIENIDNLELSPLRKRRFIKFYYDNLGINLEEALTLFKKRKK